MSRQRTVEICGALLLLPGVLLLLAPLYLLVILVDGRPFLYTSERMRAPGRSFQLYKIRTMHPCTAGESVLGGHQRERVTRLGEILRRTRLDELPQIFNVLKGDIGFIGPRPPLRRYVEYYPDLYAEVLTRRPGVTGLATVMIHRREEKLLSGCMTEHQTDSTYRDACIPMKARLDRFYAVNRSWRLDLYILYLTAVRLIPRLSSFERARSAGPRRRSRGEFGALIRVADNV